MGKCELPFWTFCKCLPTGHLKYIRTKRSTIVNVKLSHDHVSLRGQAQLAWDNEQIRKPERSRSSSGRKKVKPHPILEQTENLNKEIIRKDTERVIRATTQKGTGP